MKKVLILLLLALFASFVAADVLPLKMKQKDQFKNGNYIDKGKTLKRKLTKEDRRKLLKDPEALSAGKGVTTKSRLKR